jgi:hypothetical protein
LPPRRCGDHVGTRARGFDRCGKCVAAGALSLAALVSLSQIGAPNYSDLAANQVVEMHTSRLPVASLDELTKQSDAVVLGRVVASGAVNDARTQALWFADRAAASVRRGQSLKSSGILGELRHAKVCGPVGAAIEPCCAFRRVYRGADGAGPGTLRTRRSAECRLALLLAVDDQ